MDRWVGEDANRRRVAVVCTKRRWSRKREVKMDRRTENPGDAYTTTMNTVIN